MNSQIVRGVQVKTIQTDQFKNNTIIINFSIPSLCQFSQTSIVGGFVGKRFK
ncbi:hypothetical protein [Lentilactobacillus parafarraginis]|uniref:hypothetical protein n=1 Tax=Lentilactobacillus parafarraginis TaxID=390842 RepID=UPI0002D5F2E8|nr:hypothetical protein [Lentilactobacillus parafarraginis]